MVVKQKTYWEDTIVWNISINDATSKCSKCRPTLILNLVLDYLIEKGEYKLVQIYSFTYRNFPSSQSEAILNRRGGLSGLPSVRNNWLPVLPTKKGAMGAASFSRIGTPNRNGSWKICTVNSQKLLWPENLTCIYKRYINRFGRRMV